MYLDMSLQQKYRNLFLHSCVPSSQCPAKSIDLRSDDRKLTSCGFLIRADRTEENENTADLRQDYYDYYTEYEDYEEEDEDLVCCHKADVVAPEETDCTNLEDHVYVNRIYHLKIKVQYIESFIYRSI